MMDHTQPDLFGGSDDDPAGVRVERPAPRAHPGWEYIGGRGPKKGREDCAHCRLLWAQRKIDKGATDVKPATWIRYGRMGSTTYLCEGHRRLQRDADRNQPNAG